MTEAQDPYGAYRQARGHQSLTEQVLMLYDGVITFVKQADDAIIREDWEARWNVLNRAIAVVSGLHEALDFAQGGEAGIALDRFYRDIDTRLVHIQCHNSRDTCESVIRDMAIMRDAWMGIVRQEAGAPATSAEDTDDNTDFSGGIALNT